MNREKYFSLPTKIYLRPFVVAFNLCIASRSKNSPISPITISNRCTVSEFVVRVKNGKMRDKSDETMTVAIVITFSVYLSYLQHCSMKPSSVD